MRLPMDNIARFRNFIQRFTALIDESVDNEEHILKNGQVLLSRLIENDDWLPDQFAVPDPERYQQYLLYCDPMERFSVVSFVWGPGQKTPVHDHTVWGMVGVMRGSETCEEFNLDPDTGHLAPAGSHQIAPGGIDLVSPHIGDIHRVSNALTDRASVSIHVYGANIGAVSRHVYEFPSGTSSEFISGYSNVVIPNLWDRSAEETA
jgi:predicted metal-dependent enzyme (double-stranded beta helix superfamily)